MYLLLFSLSHNNLHIYLTDGNDASCDKQVMLRVNIRLSIHSVYVVYRNMNIPKNTDVIRFPYYIICDDKKTAFPIFLNALTASDKKITSTFIYHQMFTFLLCRCGSP